MSESERGERIKERAKEVGHEGAQAPNDQPLLGVTLLSVTFVL